MANKSIRISAAHARSIATAACLAAGASPDSAQSLVDATLSAAQFGREELGLPHLLDYLSALRNGRIDGAARPSIAHPLPGVIQCDARGGIAQLGFDIACDDLCSRARSLGVALFTQRNSFTVGELGYYVRRPALAGLIALAVANGPPLMAVAAHTARVYCTNPMAFGAPLPAGQRPLVIDQASSATAFVNLRRKAGQGEPIPPGWALDARGEPTTDACAALEGALLPFGGYKGANLALLVELLSAGVASASWSLDAAAFSSGDRCPNAGLTVIALLPPDAAFGPRLAAQLQRLQAQGVAIPSQRMAAATDPVADSIRVSEAILRQLEDDARAGAY